MKGIANTPTCPIRSRYSISLMTELLEPLWGFGDDLAGKNLKKMRFGTKTRTDTSQPRYMNVHCQFFFLRLYA
jgi:hypothetical protein